MRGWENSLLFQQHPLAEQSVMANFVLQCKFTVLFVSQHQLQRMETQDWRVEQKKKKTGRERYSRMEMRCKMKKKEKLENTKG